MTNDEILAVQEGDIVVSGSSYFWVHRIHEPSVPAAGGDVLEGRRWSQATETWGEVQRWHYIPDLAPHPLHVLDDTTRESIGFPARTAPAGSNDRATDVDTRDWHMLDQLPSPGFVPDNLDPTTKIYTLYTEQYPVDTDTGDPLVGDFAQYRMFEVGERAEDGTIRYHDSEIDTEWTYTSREGSQHDTIQQEVGQWASQLFGRPIDVQHNGAGDWEFGLPPNPPDPPGGDGANQLVQSAVVARFLRDGDRFEWDGEVLTADDNAVLDNSGDLAVVPIAAGVDNAWVEIPAQQFVRLVDPGADGRCLPDQSAGQHHNGDRDSYCAEVDTLKQAFEFELCQSCDGDLDAHTFVPDPLGHAQMLCNSEQDDEPSPDAARWSPDLVRPEWPGHGTGPTTVYRQAVARLIRAADEVAAYRGDLAAFADTLAGKKWGVAVTGPVQDMDTRLTAIEGTYRDLASQMRHQGDQGASAYDQAPWVPGPEAALT